MICKVFDGLRSSVGIVTCECFFDDDNAKHSGRQGALFEVVFIQKLSTRVKRIEIKLVVLERALV